MPASTATCAANRTRAITPPPGLLYGRKDVFGAGCGLGPARRGGLQARVKAHAFHAVHRVVAEDRTLPAAEAMKRHRHRDRHVDADHAGLHRTIEGTGRAAVTREDRRAVAELVIIDELQCFFERLDAHDAEHGSEDLLAIHA